VRDPDIQLALLQSSQCSVAEPEHAGQRDPADAADETASLLSSRLEGRVRIFLADHRGRLQSPSTTRLVSSPMPSTETETLSPATSGPIPAGVPVSSTSPGSMVITAVT
jgi:hypothetical protein